jgi:hypothetical protein
LFARIRTASRLHDRRSAASSSVYHSFGPVAVELAFELRDPILERLDKFGDEWPQRVDQRDCRPGVHAADVSSASSENRITHAS